MVVTCAWCGKQTIDGHDCPEKRAALAKNQGTTVQDDFDCLIGMTFVRVNPEDDDE